MAGSLLIVIVLIFALRGFFLGISGVIGRLTGFILGYYISYQFQSSLAIFINTQLGLDLPILVLKILSGLLLFFGTMYLSSLAINTAFKLLSQIIPPIKAILDKNSMASKVIGATINASLATVVTLLLIWGVDQFRQSTPDELTHQVAQHVGNTLIGSLNTDDWSIEKFSQFSTNTLNASTITTMTQVFSQRSTPSPSIITAPNNTLSTSKKSNHKGSATITSMADPAKTLSIDTTREVIEQVLENNPQATQQLLQSPQIQAILNDPQLRDSAMQELQNNLNSGQFSTGQLQQLLNNPQLRELLEQLGAK